MSDLKNLSHSALRAAMKGGTAEWGKWGSAAEHVRYAEPIHPASRRRCFCCRRRATHTGFANGVALMSGCEMRVARWVKQS